MPIHILVRPDGKLEAFTAVGIEEVLRVWVLFDWMCVRYLGDPLVYRGFIILNKQLDRLEGEVEDAGDGGWWAVNLTIPITLVSDAS